VNNQSDKNQDNNIHMLRYLEKKQEVSQRDIAQHLGISLGKVNYILNALVEKGIIKAKNFKNNKNKRAYAYFLTSEGIKEKAKMTLGFFKRKNDEYDKLKIELIMLEKEVEASKATLSKTNEE
jgi:EPS-associated MarR family transcriptional regulator|tara:strand:+ start:2240 stop:2608 length:369 start_codon:yes stop_codon:yes gene_type:complete